MLGRRLRRLCNRNLCCVMFLTGAGVLGYLHVFSDMIAPRTFVRRMGLELPVPVSAYNQSTPPPVYRGDDPKKPYLNLLCDLPLLDTDGWMKTQDHPANRSAMIKRELEYIYSLKTNLQHPAVGSVHLFSDKPQQLYERLARKYDVNMSKVVIYKSANETTYADMFEYVFRVLNGSFVMILNADNYMGEGFTDLDLNYLRTSKVMYSLTRRHPLPQPGVCNESSFSYCEKDSIYTGSHDSFLFFVDAPFPQAFLKEVQITNHVLGSENLVIWAFQHVVKFSVLNPCKKVFIHHLHCSRVRGSRNIRVNNKGKSGTAAFTSSLYVKNARKRTHSRR